jgi:hypothetical protein
MTGLLSRAFTTLLRVPTGGGMIGRLGGLRLLAWAMAGDGS